MGAVTAVTLGLTAASTAASFAQASKQARAAREARAAAQKYVDQARREMSVNYMNELAIAKEPYEMQQRALQQQGADILQQAAEGETRGVGAAASRIMAAQLQAQEQQRAQMAADIQALELTKRQEDNRIREMLSGLSLGEAQGAQMAARDAERARVAAVQGGVQGITEMAKLGLETIPLYEGEGKGGEPIGGKVAEVGAGLQTFRRGYEPGGRIDRRASRRQPKGGDAASAQSSFTVPQEEVGGDIWSSFDMGLIY